MVSQIFGNILLDLLASYFERGSNCNTLRINCVRNFVTHYLKAYFLYCNNCVVDLIFRSTKDEV